MSVNRGVVLVHGGAWAIPDDVAEDNRVGVCHAARQGFSLVKGGGSALDAVEAAVCAMEDNPVFDCGYGSVLTVNSTVEMDAIIMEGKQLKVGAVGCVSNIAHPVSLARAVMDKSDHTLIVGSGANTFAENLGIPTVHTDDLVTAAAKEDLQRCLKYRTNVNVNFRAQGSGHDTVGAVAIDGDGNVAFATSTGGITAKMPGRVGDSPLVGCGGYCDNEVGAISTTGHGESITKVCLASRIFNNIKQGMKPLEAGEEALEFMSNRVGGHGGAIILNTKGDTAYPFTTERMPWALAKDIQLLSGINPGDRFEESL